MNSLTQCPAIKIAPTPAVHVALSRALSPRLGLIRNLTMEA